MAFLLLLPLLRIRTSKNNLQYGVELKGKE